MGEPEILADIRDRMAKVETSQENTNNALSNLTRSIDRLVTKMDQSDDMLVNSIEEYPSVLRGLLWMQEAQ
ncbi:hypothetical protein [Marinicrinis lubricantis]|uniref:Uncharacterized protein n=1 Tax=Marinicrinis lubricantis TaxID=2086470 RepID=A0ABW1IJ60_9BACL